MAHFRLFLTFGRRCRRNRNRVFVSWFRFGCTLELRATRGTEILQREWERVASYVLQTQLEGVSVGKEPENRFRFQPRHFFLRNFPTCKPGHGMARSAGMSSLVEEFQHFPGRLFGWLLFFGEMSDQIIFGNPVSPQGLLG